VNARVLPAGDLAVLVEFDDGVSLEVNQRVRALEALVHQRMQGIVETVPAFRSLLVYYDPYAVRVDDLHSGLLDLLEHVAEAPPPTPRRIELPCCYDDATLGFDLEAVAARIGCTTEELIAMHSAAEYPVYFLGFAPGQPYMTGTPDRLQVPRLATPRTVTPAGSVGIAGPQCCVYSVTSPGGFHVLGRTPLKLYDPDAPQPVLLQPGDRVTFRAIARSEYDRIAAAVEVHSYVPRIS
jgi:inhibitor of KinA